MQRGVQHVAVALGGEEADLRQVPGDDRVEAVGARVVEDRHVVDAEAAGALEHRALGDQHVGGDLGDLDPAVATRDDVRERPADVDPDHEP
jgi:hypothetical protein